MMMQQTEQHSEPRHEMDHRLPGIVVTGASGFVGRHFLEAAKGRYRLFCLARRSQFEAGIPKMEHQRWTQVDIAHRDALLRVRQCIEEHGGADFVVHLAGYYDFTNRDNPEYERTNVRGTENVLELARTLRVRRVLFSSSLAACRFPDPGSGITEDSPADARFPYARSKHDAECLMRDFDAPFARSIIRFAAIYSDWCEYPPVYAFLKTWLSTAWNARLLGGRGESAVPYLHIRDLVSLLLRVIERSDILPGFAVYNASPSHSTSHQDLYCAARRFLYGHVCSPVHIPRWLAIPAVALRQAVFDALGRPPFERTWMLRYIDQDLRVDSSRTQAETGWSPTPRYDLCRRLLILIENMKTQPELWGQRNEAAFVHVTQRVNFIIAGILRANSQELIGAIVTAIRDEQHREGYRDYGRMDEQTLAAHVTLFFEILVSAIRTRDRRPVRTYARLLAFHRRRQGFVREHVCAALEHFRPVLRAHLLRGPHPAVRAAHVQEYVDLSLQLALDEIEEAYDQQEAQAIDVPADGAIDIFSDAMAMIRMVDELHDICHDGSDIQNVLRSARTRTAHT